MKRMKRLGVITCAVAAMSMIIGAAAASAADRSLTVSGEPQKFTVTSTPSTEAYPAFIGGDLAGEVKFSVGEDGAINCGAADLLGYRGAPAANLIMGGSISDCSYPGLGPVTVAMNSCAFDFHLGDEEYVGDVGVGCESGKAMKLTVALSSGPICVIDIPAQQIAEAIYLPVEDKVIGVVGRSGVGSEFDYEVEHTSPFGFLCGSEGFHSDGAVEAVVVLNALDESPF